MIFENYKITILQLRKLTHEVKKLLEDVKCLIWIFPGKISRTMSSITNDHTRFLPIDWPCSRDAINVREFMKQRANYRPSSIDSTGVESGFSINYLINACSSESQDRLRNRLHPLFLRIGKGDAIAFTARTTRDYLIAGMTIRSANPFRFIGSHYNYCPEESWRCNNLHT